MLIDTHSHLNFKQFDEDRDSVIRRAGEIGVDKIIVVGSDLENSREAINLASHYPQLFATLGLHPAQIDLHWQKKIKKINEILLNHRRKDRVVALGEVGLDYHQKNRLIKKEVQFEALEVFIDLASKFTWPIIFHCREAMDDFIWVLKKNKGVKGVLHCFPGNKEDAERILNLGLFISFTGLVTFVSDFDEVIKHVPLEKMMIETDCPFLTPKPYRGERNEPAYVVEVARRIAEIKDIPYFKVAEETTKNAVQLFGLESLNNLASDLDYHVTTPRQ